MNESEHFKKVQELLKEVETLMERLDDSLIYGKIGEQEYQELSKIGKDVKDRAVKLL